MSETEVRSEPAASRTSTAGFVLFVLAVAQFLMTLDTSVMNVSIADVAADVGTTVTGIQTAITLYTLVMASLMISGGKLGEIIGRRKVFSIGLVVYGAGSFVTSISPNLPTLLFGWSLLEGIGAAMILPAIVGLVAVNFAPDRRQGAYGSIAAASAIAVAAGPLIGGAVTTYASWRWVFAGEVFIVIFLLFALRRIQDTPPEHVPQFDGVGAVLSILGLSMIVFGVLKSGTWGWVHPKPGGKELFGTSPVVWLVIGGFAVLRLLLFWEHRVVAKGGDPLVRPGILRNRQLAGGLSMFGLQYFVQAGTFFVIPLFLSVVLELSAVQTGARLLPLSIALLISAVGVPRLAPSASPRLVVRIGLACMLLGTLLLIGGIDIDSNAGVVMFPMLLMGLGIGALASQLGAVTVSSVPTERSAEIGGIQNTVMNLGASLGTALCGAVLISTLTTGIVNGVNASTTLPPNVQTTATTQLETGVPFVSDTHLQTALDQAGVPSEQSKEIVQVNRDARIEALHEALWVVALAELLALFLDGLVPVEPPGKEKEEVPS